MTKAAVALCLLAVSASGMYSPEMSCPAGGAQQLWGNVRFKGKNVKCHQACATHPLGCGTVASQAECQERAVIAGHKFYSYRSFDRKCSTSSSCKPIVAKTPWHSYQVMWPEVKEGNYKCHTKCRERVCTQVASQAECQAASLALGVKFYSYRDADRLCAPTASCNNMTITQPGYYSWRAYGSEDVLTLNKKMIWSMVGGSAFHKCHTNCSVDQCFYVKNQAACRAIAVQSGNTYYSYRGYDKKCTTTQTCAKYVAPTKKPWKAFQMMWDRVLDTPAKCHSTCAQDGCFQVVNKATCQRIAEASGDKFYSFRPTDHMCATTKSCDQPKPTISDWRTFASM